MQILLPQFKRFELRVAHSGVVTLHMSRHCLCQKKIAYLTEGMWTRVHADKPDEVLQLFASFDKIAESIGGAVPFLWELPGFFKLNVRVEFDPNGQFA